jgi:hypothetical protein
MTETEKARIIDAIEEVQWWHMMNLNSARTVGRG